MRLLAIAGRSAEMQSTPLDFHTQYSTLSKLILSKKTLVLCGSWNKQETAICLLMVKFPVSLWEVMAGIFLRLQSIQVDRFLFTESICTDEIAMYSSM